MAPTWHSNRERDIRVTKIIASGIEFRFFKMESPRVYDRYGREYINGYNLLFH